MGTDFSQFKDLTPERRIRELQKLIDNLKKEIEDKQKEIGEAEKLLALADEQARLLEQVEIPETKPIPRRKAAGKTETIEEKTEEKPQRRITREEQIELEKLLATAPPRSEELFHEFAHRRVEELYGELRRIYDREKTTGIETEKDREMIYAIRKGIEIKKEEGYKPANKRSEHLMTAAEQMAENMYQGGAGTYKRTPV